jgi:hypothetical protein
MYQLYTAGPQGFFPRLQVARDVVQRSWHDPALSFLLCQFCDLIDQMGSDLNLEAPRGSIAGNGQDQS